ncbi:MAG TPA: hypothetical protein VGV15_22325 [Terriglobales bacterium]|nr:hypothetical protein [Terriglobales bacterium]
MLRVPQAPAVGQVSAQSTPELAGSLLTTGVNWIPVVLPTGTLVVVGAGLRAIETPAGALLEDLLLPLLHASEKEIADMIRNISIRRLTATAILLRECTVSMTLNDT